MLWGNKPIRSRLILDILTLTILTYSVFLDTEESSERYFHIGFISLAVLSTILTVGLTQRWTISIPMIPLVLIQFTRYFVFINWFSSTVKWVSILLLLKALILSLLYPALEISSPRGKYHVGIVDIHLPVANFECSHVSVRILYPCNEARKKSFRYLQKDTADDICKQMMMVGAPGPLKRFVWMLDQWKLSRIHATRNGSVLKPEEKKDGWPVAIFSHGLLGGAFLYSYQTLSLASNGMIVLSVNHSDGSAIGLKTKDGMFQAYDSAISELNRDETLEEYVKVRRNQADYRSNEIIAALDAFLNLNKNNSFELESVGVSLVGLLNTNDITAVGHSFGGATALTMTARNPERIKACIALDPAVDWIPDVERRVLLSEERLKDSNLCYNGGTGGFSSDAKLDLDQKSERLHSVDLFFLYSDEWMKKKWGASHFIFDMFKRGKLGSSYGNSDCSFIYSSNHSEFSDVCMKTPLWLGRATGMTGIRNPHDTSEEIASRIQNFLVESRHRFHD